MLDPSGLHLAPQVETSFRKTPDWKNATNKTRKPRSLRPLDSSESSLPIPSTLWARCHPVPPSATGDVGPGRHHPWQLEGGPAPTHSPSYAKLKSYVLSFQGLRMFSFCFLNYLKNLAMSKGFKDCSVRRILERDFYHISSCFYSI